MDIFLITARRKSKDSFEFAKKQLEALGYDLGSVKKIYMVSKPSMTMMTMVAVSSGRHVAALPRRTAS